MDAKAAPIFDDDDAWFTPDCEAALREFFQRMDVDQDGVWNMSELQSWAAVCNGRAFTQAYVLSSVRSVGTRDLTMYCVSQRAEGFP